MSALGQKQCPCSAAWPPSGERDYDRPRSPQGDRVVSSNMVAALPSSYLASFRTSSGSLAILLAIRRASSLVSSLAAERRPVGLKHFQLKFDDPSHASISSLAVAVASSSSPSTVPRKQMPCLIIG